MCTATFVVIRKTQPYNTNHNGDITVQSAEATKKS